MAAVAASSTPELGSSGSQAGDSPHLACRRRSGPAAWLRRALRGAQAVSEERPTAHSPDDDENFADDASSIGGTEALLHDCSFGSLPEHLLEKVFSHLRGTNRKHHFAICGVNRQWRRLGQGMFFSRPWEVAHLICHPTQLFCLSPRNVTGSRSGLLKCFVRRESGTGGKRFTFHIGKDATQPQRSRFLMAAKPGGRDEMHLYLNSRCEGQPCARLRCNMFATQYKLTLSEDLQLEPTGTSRTRRQAAADADSAAAARRGQFSRLSSWGPEAAAEAAEAVAAVAAQRRRWQQQQQEEQQLREGEGRPQTRLDQLGVDCFADLHYQARVKGFMQPRRMRVLLPHPSLLFYDQQLPHLSRRCSESDAMAAAIAGMSVTGRSETGASTAASSCASPEASPQPAAVVGLSSATAGTHAVEETAVGFVGPCRASSGRLARLLSSSRPRRGQLLRQQKTVPADEGLQPVVLQNKAPHWNEGLRCWCLNFRGRVKLASVKNFQLVRGNDPAERVVMQFGKAEQDAFILDFNPTVLTALTAFGLVLSTFDSKFLL
ncbi:hypothetical protein D9Q98_007272 [Chlorella vulgaris]|uniref:Tubby C-terminal domain-containing protein n=1 Tax=Chlorella vulgaris TaxID=3077 RepID=A0A9D4YVQ1_CHLVU|nr:hypothetical protein D9Q98_007272 [Chlorella vulgaris]